MSSSSIARQNRRLRIKQNISTLDTETKQMNIPIKKSSAEKIINATTSNSQSDKANFNAKSSYEIELDSYSRLSYDANCDFLNGNVLSQPIEKIFIEGDRAFKEINASDIFQISQANITIQTNSEKELFIDSAFKIAKYFHSFSNFSHGLLGGLSLFYLLVLLHLFSDLLVDEDTAKYFSFFSKPIHNLFNLLCIICCISVFDRFDIANIAKLFKLLKKLHLKLITLFIYPICLLLSLSTANIDEKLNASNQNASVWYSLNFKEESELYYWKILSLSKCFGALLGWMVLCPDQNFNLFFDYIRCILKRRIIPQQ